MFLKDTTFHKKIVFLFIAIIGVLLFSNVSASAAPISYEDFTPEQEATSWLYYGAIGKCVKDFYLKNDTWLVGGGFKGGGWVANSKLTIERANSGKFFGIPTIGVATDPSIAYYMYGSPEYSASVKDIMDDENLNCTGEKSTWILPALKFWGFPYDSRVSAGMDAVCRFGGKRIDESNCYEGGGDFTGTKSWAASGFYDWKWVSVYSKLDIDKFKSTINKEVYKDNRPSSLSGAALYVLNKNVFFGGCLGSANPMESSQTYSAADDRMYKVPIPQADPADANHLISAEKIYYASNSDGTHDHSREYMASTADFKNKSTTCISLANNMTTYIQSYIDWYNDKNSSGGTPILPPVTPGTGSGTVASTAATCGTVITTGVGWIVCPIVSTLTALNDGMWKFVENLLFVNPISKSSDGVYSGWVTIRNISNVLFVIAFLVIIFSQLSGFGVSNYGVKKLLPRIIVVAIAINLSFIMMQLAIDATNIIGKGLYEAIYKSAPTPTIGWADAIKLILATGTGAAAAGGLILGAAVILGPEAALLALLPILLSALVAFLAAALTLILRQAAIPILAMLAPLAFTANLLPNTEQLFKRWSKLLLNMLMLYPLAALVFAGARFASAAVIGEAVTNNETFTIIIGLIVLSLPLFSLPFLSRQGAPMLAKVSGALNNFGKRITAPASEFSKELSKDARTRADNAAMNNQNPGRFAGLRQRYLRFNARRRAVSQTQESELNRGTADYISNEAINNEEFRGRMAAGGADGADRRALAGAINISAEINAKEVKAAEAVINRLDLDAKEIQGIASGAVPSIYRPGFPDVKVDSAMREAAIARAGAISTVDDMEAIVASSGSMSSDQRRTLVSTLGANGFKAKAAWYNGATMGKIQAGGITSSADIDSIIAGTIEKADISAEELMAMDADALIKMHKVMGSMDAAKAAKLKKVAAEAVTNPLLSSKIKEDRLQTLTDLAS